MSELRQLRLAGAAIFLLCAWNARDLLGAWRHSPFDRLGWLALLLWLLPLAVEPGRRQPRSALFYLGLALSALGTMTELNVLTNAGLACAAAGFVAGEAGRTLPWLATAVCWMPAFGWLAAPLGPGCANGARLLGALGGSAFFLLYRSRPHAHA